MKRALLLALALSTAGCNWMLSSPKEYATYRKTRVEKTFDLRVRAAHDYLAKYPNGAYAADVKGYYDRAEPAFYTSHERDVAGLEAYLKALPKGPHASQARSKLAAIAEQRAQPDSLLTAAKGTEERLASAAKSRERATNELTFWIDGLADREAYVGPMAEGPADLVVGFSLSLPAPKCKAEGSGRACDKDVLIQFLVPGAQGLIEREMAFTVTIHQDDAGRPLASRIEGDELFSRLEEAESLRAVDSRSVDDRVAAVSRIVELVTNSFESHISADPSCRKPITVPEVLHLECNGMRAIAIAGTQPGASDAIELGPAR